MTTNNLINLRVDNAGLLEITQNELLTFILTASTDKSEKNTDYERELLEMIARPKPFFSPPQLKWILSKVIYITKHSPLYKKYKGIITDITITDYLTPQNTTTSSSSNNQVIPQPVTKPITTKPVKKYKKKAPETIAGFSKYLNKNSLSVSNESNEESNNESNEESIPERIF